MLEFFKRLLWDESAFERWGRVVVFLLGEAVRNGSLPVPPEYTWLGVLLQSGALLIAAGEKNAPKANETDGHPPAQ